MAVSDCCQEYIVFDDRTGDEICTSCARAKCTFAPSLVYSPNSNNSRTTSFCEIEDELSIICDKHHISKCIFNDALELLRGEERKTRIKAAQCLHKALMSHNAPRSFKELSSMFYIPFTQIAKYDDVSSLKPSDLCSRVLPELTINCRYDNAISKQKEKEIAHLADELFENQMCCGSPQASLAVSIAMHCKGLFPLLNIARACHISKQTLIKHVKAQRDRA